jgi:hypothetical protein
MAQYGLCAEALFVLRNNAKINRRESGIPLHNERKPCDDFVSVFFIKYNFV